MDMYYILEVSCGRSLKVQTGHNYVPTGKRNPV